MPKSEFLPTLGADADRVDADALRLGDLGRRQRGDLAAVVHAVGQQDDYLRLGLALAQAEQPYAMGYQTIWAAVETTAPKKSVVIEKNVLSNPAWIDADCLDDPDYSGYLYTE